MKLEKLFESSIDFTSIKGSVSSEVYEAFEESMKVLTKGLIFDRQESATNDHVSFYFHNGLLEMQVYTYVSNKKNDDQYVNLGVKVDVSKKLLVETKDNSSSLINTFTYIDAQSIETQMKKVETINKHIQEFVDWYFDLSDEYGKVKLIGSSYNLVDGYHRSGEQRFIAVAGDFHCVSDSSDDETQKRIFK